VLSPTRRKRAVAYAEESGNHLAKRDAVSWLVGAFADLPVPVDVAISRAERYLEAASGDPWAEAGVLQPLALLQRLSALSMPVLVANGDSDPMILPHYSYLLAGLIPQARVKIYPDSAHGFLFQHGAQFAADVEAFLGSPT